MKSRINVNRTKKRGGAKLGEGSFGCVIYPHIPCKSGKSYKIPTASKLVKISDRYPIRDLQEELRANKLIRALDPSNKYFVSILDYCKLSKVSRRIFESRNNVRMQYYNSNGEDDSKCVLNTNRVNYNLIMPYAGVDLYYVLKKSKYFDIKAAIKTKIKFVVRHLLTAIHILHRHQLAHRDIKPENMLFNLRQQDNASSRQMLSCGIIDFGLIYDVRRLGESSNEMLYTVGSPGYIPVEYYLKGYLIDYKSRNMDYSVLKTKILDKINIDLEELDSIYREGHIGIFDSIRTTDKITKDTVARILLPSSNLEEHRFLDRSLISKMYDVFSDLVARNKLILEFYRPISGLIYKHDIFSMGMVFYEIFKSLELDDPQFLDLIKHMVELDPFKRFTVLECLEHSYLHGTRNSKN